jgi:hypothetical protein
MVKATLGAPEEGIAVVEHWAHQLAELVGAL